MQIFKACLVTAFAFASPKVGDSEFKRLFSSHQDLRALRVRNALDCNKLPLHRVLGRRGRAFHRYPNVKFPKEPRDRVDMAQLGGISPWHSGGSRTSALVNKSMDELKDEFMVPVSWWCEKNKGMVQQEDGSWKLMDHEDDR